MTFIDKQSSVGVAGGLRRHYGSSCAVLFFAGLLASETSVSAAPLFVVHNASELRAAIASAGTTGATIRVFPGNYGALNLYNRRYTGQLNLVAATGERPVFSSIILVGVHNAAVAGMQVTGSGRPIVNLSHSRRVALTGNLISGINRNQDPWDDGQAGVHVRWAENVVVSNNIFEDLRSVLFSQGSRSIVVEHNTVRFVREGINVASTRNLRITNNSFHSFFPNVPRNEHSDAIQFWTWGETEGSQDVTISDNAMLFGGCRAIQGIFIRSETENAPRAQVRHARFTIERNVYYGSARNGLSVSSVDDATIRNNVVVNSPYADRRVSRAEAQQADPRCSGSLTTGILSRFGSTTHRFEGNVTHVLGSTEGTRNNDIAIRSDGGLAWEDVFDRRPTADVPRLDEFVTKAPSSLRSRNIGLLQAPPHGVQPWSADAALARSLSILQASAGQ